MPTTAPRHQWHIRFDRVVCRDCDAERGHDDWKKCKSTSKIRPLAGIRNVSLLGQKPKTDPNSLPLSQRAANATPGTGIRQQ